MRIILSLAVIVMLGACAGQPHIPVPPEVEVTDTPPVGEKIIREVGQTLVHQSNLYMYEALVPHKPLRYEVALATGYFTYKGDLIASIGPDGVKRYCGPYVQMVGQRENHLGKGCVDQTVMAKYFKLYEGDYTIKKIARSHAESYQRQIIYTGKSGNTIYLMYREFKNDMARPAFTQNLTFDLSDSKVVGVMGARLKVMKATNTNIEYVLQSRFIDRQ